MLILSVESTCDETAVAITENGRKFNRNAAFLPAIRYFHVKKYKKLTLRAPRDQGFIQVGQPGRTIGAL